MQHFHLNLIFIFLLKKRTVRFRFSSHTKIAIITSLIVRLTTSAQIVGDDWRCELTFLSFNGLDHTEEKSRLLQLRF